MQLANALYPLFGSAPPLEAALDEYRSTLEREQRSMFADKLGLERSTSHGEARAPTSCC